MSSDEPRPESASPDQPGQAAAQPEQAPPQPAAQTHPDGQAHPAAQAQPAGQAPGQPPAQPQPQPAATWGPPRQPPPPPPVWGPPPPAPVAAPVATETGGSAFKRGFGLGSGIGLSLLLLGLVGTVLSGLVTLAFAGAAGALAGSGQLAAQGLVTVWGPESATGRIRAIPVTGTILTDASDGAVLSAGTYGYETAQVLDNLTAEDADAVLLLMNTPGGSVTGSRAMHDAVDRYRERTGKKVYAYVQGLSASGGMYTMANADEILADHGSLVGSIGVILGPIERYRDVTALTGNILTSGVVTEGGITAEYITAGRGKDAGSPWRDLTPEERGNLQAFIDFEYDNFVSVVADGRGIDRSVIVDQLGASLLDTQRAQQAGLIDGTSGREEAFRRFAQSSGLDPDNTKVVESAPPSYWAQLLGAEARAWGAAPAVEPIEGQPARATSSICRDNTLPLVWHGDLASVCG